ncbi:MAG TPA: hypothetical protein VK498_05065 [Ferruginibacter sp.]|nr:hypothetical protein [Ferruginibacter sp.]
MKSYKELVTKYSASELAESYVFPNDLNKDQREEALETFREFRKKDSSKRTKESKLLLQLLQLRFWMEDYIQETEFKKNYDFSFFLKEYISRQEKKNKEFASEIDVDPSELSQIINKHRPPNEKFIIRLELHSNNNFPAISWFKLIEKEKTFQLMNDNQLRNSESKHVKSRLNFTF